MNYIELLYKMVIYSEFPIKNGGSFHSYVSLPEGISPQKTLLRGRPLELVERVDWMKWMKPSHVGDPWGSQWGEAQIATFF